jgi:hypothetical protein
MILSQFHNANTKLLGALSRSDKIKVFGAYKRICDLIYINSDEIYVVDRPIKPSMEDIKFMISFITIYNNLLEIFCSNNGVKFWLDTPRDDYPFLGKSPKEVIWGDHIKLLDVRVYTNSLIVHLREQMGEY